MNTNSGHGSAARVNFHDISFDVFSAESIEALREIALNGERAEQEAHDSNQRERFEQRLFERGRILTLGDPGAAFEFIVEFLLRRLVDGDRLAPAGSHKSVLRQVLKEWVEQYENLVTESIRGLLSDRLADMLRSDATVDVIQVIAILGLAHEDILNEMWRIADGTEFTDEFDLVDHALSALSAMEIRADHRLQIVQKTFDRAARLPNQLHGWTLGRLAHYLTSGDVETAIALYDRQRENEEFSWKDGLLWLLGNVVSEHAGDDHIEKTVFEACNRIATKEEQTIGLSLRSYIWSECRVSDIPGTLLYLASREKSIAADSSKRAMNHSEHLWLLRAEQCLYPVQLNGWRELRTLQIAERYIYDVATKSSGEINRSRMETEGHRHKEQAWRIIMRCGLENAMHWLDGALESEPPGFVQDQILELAAGLPFNELPDSVNSIIQMHEVDDEDEHLRDSKYFAQSGAIEFAELIATQRCLEAISNTSFHSNGHAFTSAANALTTVSLVLADKSEADRDFVIAKLTAKLATTVASWQRPSAARALSEVLAKYPSKKSAELLWRLLQSFQKESPAIPEDARNYVCEYVISALGQQVGFVSIKRIDYLVELASADLTQVGWRAADALLTLKVWNENTAELWAKIERDLPFEDPKVSTFPGNPKIGWAAHCLGRLYASNPTRAFPILELAIRSTMFPPIEQLRPHIVRAFSSARGSIKEHRRLSTSSLSRLLVERARDNINPFQSETSAIAILAQVDQKRLKNLVIDFSESWMPGARVSVAIALRQSTAQPITAVGIETLKHLTADSTDEVRQAAIESLALVKPTCLAEVIFGWWGDTDWRVRRHAVNAAAFLDRGLFNRISSEVVGTEQSEPEKDPIEAARIDREPRVRNAVPEALQSRSRRSAAAFSLSKIARGLCEDQRVIDLWHFGDCLSEWGDLCHAEQLTSLLVSVDNARSRWWLIRIAKTIRERLEKSSGAAALTPAEAIQSRIVHGKLALGGWQTSVSATIWRPTTRLESTNLSWGGVIVMRSAEADAMRNLIASIANIALYFETDVNETLRVQVKYFSGNSFLFSASEADPNNAVSNLSS